MRPVILTLTYRQAQFYELAIDNAVHILPPSANYDTTRAHLATLFFELSQALNTAEPDRE